MGEHQSRLWEHMICAIDEYLSDRIELHELIDCLEHSLKASEVKDDTLIKEFYSKWEPLETQYACSIEMATPIDHDSLRLEIQCMKEFLVRTKEEIAAYDPRDF